MVFSSMPTVLVEDEELLRQILNLCLLKDGFEVLLAANGDEKPWSVTASTTLICAGRCWRSWFKRN